MLLEINVFERPVKIPGKQNLGLVDHHAQWLCIMTSGRLSSRVISHHR
jgi:hypothetical protein